ncbi:cysteine peptidase family C39 domain-containing protein [Clostridioides difficile]|nr:cysteine peptidase family C39 domain-containing protein [Clostridioides difficile]MDC9252414.1 cysteine peptidase family C39 domain-containing protein [Clostridioides difficile]
MQQQDATVCGVACLSMILKYFKTDIPIHKLRTYLGLI